MEEALKTVMAYIARAERERQMIQEGLDDVTAGKLISMDTMARWADSLGTDHELLLPSVSYFDHDKKNLRSCD